MTLNEYVNSLRGKRVCVIGFGISNLPLIRLLSGAGISLTVCDKNSALTDRPECREFLDAGVRFVTGEDYLSDLDYDIVFRTPGLHPMKFDASIRPDTVVTSEMEVFFRLCPCRTVAITGSDGKTTTSTVISELLKREGYRVHLGGNIGKPLLCEVDSIGKDDFAVLELSSFQLLNMHCSPDIAVVTNVSPNHLDMHPDLEDYINAKRNVYRNQTPQSRLVLNADNQVAASFAENAPARVSFFSAASVLPSGYSFSGGMIFRNGEPFMPASEILVPGMHNVENFMAAFAAVDGLVSPENCLAVAREFAGVEHRIEFVREKDGVRYYNDSIGSSPTRTIRGLQSFDQKVILIAGGHDKLVPFDALAKEILLHVKALFLTGESAEKIRASVLAAPGFCADTLPVTVIDDFREAVYAASAYAASGDVVILSPACSSFDKFRNFEERGNYFKEIVNEL